MIALSGVGVASALSGMNGVQVPLASMLGADIHTGWLANKSAAGPRTSSGASAPTAHASSKPATAVAANNAGTNNAGTNNADTNNAEPTTSSAPTDSRVGTKSSASPGMTADGKVILNLAGMEDLRHLPGIGSKRANAIMELRARLGRFKQVNDLLRVKGIGVRGLKKLMPHIVLDPPKPSNQS